MGKLKCDKIDFNNEEQVKALQAKLQSIIDDPKNYYQLKHTKNYYFSTNIPLPQESGWYIILDGPLPIYVGKAEDLNKRLNTEDGSRDQFANPQRSSDTERNFIKKYNEVGLIRSLRVCIVTESSLGFSGLTDLDRGNIEKHLNICRGYFHYRDIDF
ncbi:MAG: hypothetical protein QXO63_03980 [Thermoplasmatales archaeon]